MKQLVVMALGRFNPPTRGHSVLLDQLESLAQRVQALPVVFVVDGAKSRCDGNRNPLRLEHRISLLQSWHPRLQVVATTSAWQAVEQLAGQQHIHSWVAGSDRAVKYQKLLAHAGLVETQVQAVTRTAESISATAARQAACEGNWPAFVRMMPLSATHEQLENIWVLIRRCHHELQQPGLLDNPNQ